MTKPSLTYGHGYCTDCDSTTGWAEVEDGNTGTHTIRDNTFFKLAVSNSAGNKIYFVYNTSDIDISSSVYTKAAFRYVCSSTSIKAKIVLEFDDATFQTLLGETGVTSLTYGTADITAAKTIDHVRLHANQATGNVYYDFLLLHKGTFTLPFASDTEELELLNNYAYIKIPGRVGNITQYLGADSPIIRLSGIMDTGTGWHGAGSADGFDLMTIWKQMHSDPFQWLASDLINCQVTMPSFKISKVAGSKVARKWTLEARHYSLGTGDESIWTGLSWLGLT